MSVDVEKVIRDYLPNIVHMSLGTSKDNKPWVCEVHFAYDNDLNLYFRSLTSRRHSQEIATNPNVAGNMAIQCAVGEPCKGVVDFEGTAEMLQAGDEQSKVFELIKARLKTSDDILTEAQNPDGHQFYKITVVNWYVFGKLDGEGGKKYQLRWNGGKKEA